MSFRRAISVIAACFLLCSSGVTSATELKARTWTIDGVKRESLLAVPENAKQTPSPLVFVFHGHGGNTRQVSRSFRIHELWNEAIVVYLQGLNTPGQLTDPEGKRPGWQKEKGDQNDRDLKLFDEVLKSLKEEYKVDEKRIFSTGHSNGGGFTYLLWSERPEVFAAFAPSGSAALRIKDKLKPKPVLHIAGDNDPLVKYAWQTTMIESLKKRNQCGEGQPWEEKCTQFPSKIGAPVITFVTSQGHKFPAEAPALIVKFFKQY